MRLRFLVEGFVSVETVASEAEDRCVPVVAVVGGEVVSSGVRCRCHIGLVCWLGCNAVICFRMPARTEGVAYYVVGGSVLFRWQRWRRKGELAQIVRNCNE